MDNVSEFAAKGQQLVTRAVDSVLDTVRDTAPRTAAQIEKVADLVPTPDEVMEQVTATAKELLSLSQEIQSKVIAALRANA